jgi:hypothetical protein
MRLSREDVMVSTVISQDERGLLIKQGDGWKVYAYSTGSDIVVTCYVDGHLVDKYSI